MNKGYSGSRKYRSELGASASIVDILPHSLTLYPELNPVMWRETRDSGLKTIFHEVAIMPFDEANPHAKKQLGRLVKIERQAVSEERYAAIMWDTLKKAIYELWEPERKHYIFTSSGYDSRLIAYAIRKLYEAHGANWLGDTYFVEADGESVQFRSSMEMMGWLPDQCIVYNEGAPVHEYHARSLNFSTAWEKLGGMCGYVVNFRLEAEKWMQERGLMPVEADGLQTLAGYFSNEIVTTMLKNMTLYQYFSRAYVRSLSTPRHWMGGTQSPFQHYGMITAQLRYGAEHLVARTGISQLMLRHFAPAELADLPSPKHKSKLGSVRKISDRLLNQAINDYSCSWFGTQFPNVEPVNLLRYDKWWAHWCVASFCSYLRKHNYKIEIEKEKANVS